MEPDMSFTFEAEIWLYSGKGAWHFLTLPEEVAGTIRMFGGRRRGFGQLPVMATIGKTRFSSSIFPDSRSGSYLLPLKAEIRRKEKLAAGDRVAVSMTVNP